MGLNEIKVWRQVRKQLENLVYWEVMRSRAVELKWVDECELESDGFHSHEMGGSHCAPRCSRERPG